MTNKTLSTYDKIKALAKEGKKSEILDNFTLEDICDIYNRISNYYNLNVPSITPGWCYIVKECRDKLVLK